MAKKKEDTMYKRPDGLYEKKLIINGKRKVFRAKSEPEIWQRVAAYKGDVEKGRLFKAVAEEWKDKHWLTLSPNSKSNYTPAYNRAVAEFGGRYVKQIRPNDISAFIINFALVSVFFVQ